MSASIQTMDPSRIESLVRNAIAKVLAGEPEAHAGGVYVPKLVVSISARHVHLTDEHVEKLFGKGKTLTPEKDLYQDGFFAAA
ncbi:MAG: PduL/EutD family phosphate acyltransferase, partial [Pirellula sp.]